MVGRVTRVTTAITIAPKAFFTIVGSAIVAEYLWSQLCSEGQQGHNRAGCKGLRRLRPSWAQLASYLIEVDVLRMLRYCRMSGTVIKRKARKKRRPVHKRHIFERATKD